LHIMSDSQSCLYMIANMIAAPHDMMEHRNRTMLHAIFEIVKQSPHTIHLYIQSCVSCRCGGQ
jgi:hypothetical protein